MRLNKRQILKATESLELRQAKSLRRLRVKAFFFCLASAAGGFAAGVALLVLKPQAWDEAMSLAKAVFGG